MNIPREMPDEDTEAFREIEKGLLDEFVDDEDGVFDEDFDEKGPVF